MKYEWVLNKEQRGIDEMMCLLLKERGITSEEEKKEFLSQRPKLTYDPFLMKDMEEASGWILRAIDDGKQICIYGDYDADGICSISLIFEILTKLSAKVSYYIPSRFDEGYGLNKEAIKLLQERGVDLILTVDCGSVSKKEVEYAKEIGLDIIVTDHHNLDKNGVDCLLINPKQANCEYPEEELSGCGVAFKLIQALQRKVNPNNDKDGILTKKDLNSVLDLIAIATIGDVVPLLGENRTFVKYGIRNINSGNRFGLTKLINGIGLELGEILSDKIAYAIVPHLNAAGRILTAETGVTLLISNDEKEVTEAVDLLIDNNKERRRVQEEILKKALTIVEKHHSGEPILIVDVGDSHEGIAGIVAGRLKEHYYRPTILLTSSGNGELKGTGRSIDGINLYKMLSAHSSLFKRFGGHESACGFLMDEENLPALRDFLLAKGEEIFKKEPDIFESKLYIDGELTTADIDFGFVNKIKELEPFGHKNPRPIFCLRDVGINKVIYMGEGEEHVRFFASDVSCILFNHAKEYRELLDGNIAVDLVGYPEINSWKGNEKIQFVVLDIRCYNEKDY